MFKSVRYKVKIQDFLGYTIYSKIYEEDGNVNKCGKRECSHFFSDS
jgi:hypothetical protein